MKKTNFEDFNRESFLIKRGANRAKLYHKYRKDLIENFQPQPDVLEKTNKILQEIFWTTVNYIIFIENVVNPLPDSWPRKSKLCLELKYQILNENYTHNNDILCVHLVTRPCNINVFMFNGPCQFVGWYFYILYFTFYCCSMWQEYLQVETEFRDSNILVGIYLEAEDFEYFRKFRIIVNQLVLKYNLLKYP